MSERRKGAVRWNDSIVGPSGGLYMQPCPYSNRYDTPNPEFTLRGRNRVHVSRVRPYSTPRNLKSNGSGEKMPQCHTRDNDKFRLVVSIPIVLIAHGTCCGNKRVISE